MEDLVLASCGDMDFHFLLCGMCMKSRQKGGLAVSVELRQRKRGAAWQDEGLCGSPEPQGTCLIISDCRSDVRVWSVWMKLCCSLLPQPRNGVKEKIKARVPKTVTTSYDRVFMPLLRASGLTP